MLNIWNWKSALLGAAYRGPIFFFTSLKAGWRSALAAMLTETAFRALTSGLWGAFTQALRLLQPAWLAVFLVGVVAPIVVQSLELLLHMARGTPNLRRGFWVSCIITAIASLFNLYVMRRGTLITGEAGQSLKSDLRHLPRLIIDFVVAGPLALWRLLRPLKQTAAPERVP